YHAVHFGLDDYPADDHGVAHARAAQEGGRAGAQSHEPIYALPHGAAGGVPILWHLGRPRRGRQRRVRPRLVLSHRDGDHTHRRDDVPLVARRARHPPPPPPPHLPPPSLRHPGGGAIRQRRHPPHLP